AYSLIEKLEDTHWREIKLKEINEIIAAAAGLYLEAVAISPTATPGSEMGVQLEVINRSNADMTLISVELEPNNSKLEPGVSLVKNSSWKKLATLKIGEKADITSPYWLRKKGNSGLYKVEDQNLVGLPENPKTVKAKFLLNIDGTRIPKKRPVVYKYNDAEKVEVYQPFEIVPPVSAAFREKVLIIANGEPKNIAVTITAYRDNVEGEISLTASKNWKIIPEQSQFKILNKGGSVTLNFSVAPPSAQEETVLSPSIKIDGKVYSEEIINIKYDHIPVQTLVMPSQTKLVKLDIQKKGENIGYIEGAGDVIPESMEQIGYKVTRIDPAGITAGALQNYDAIVVGIRAYNTIEALKFAQPTLLKYVENGGTLIVQYNVNRGILASPLAPYALSLSRERVTEEDAEVRFLDPTHPILNTPNKLTSADFEGWVQERGLYFADSWGPEFTPVLSMNDKNESPKDGSLVVAKHGKGYFIYTGLSFFRQFPEGVPGAFRLFANMISIGK
ncbi:MAG TPA: hypothetical protein VK916_03335, partial [Gillisia sp.]|nr:hypothetical protein [Gillisia sp.]